MYNDEVILLVFGSRPIMMCEIEGRNFFVGDYLLEPSLGLSANVLVGIILFRGTSVHHTRYFCGIGVKWGSIRLNTVACGAK